MALSAFDDKASPPKKAELTRVLGRVSPYWDTLLATVEEKHPPTTCEWGFAGAKWGWSLRLKRGKRNILYLTPCRGHFLAGTALGGKAVRAALDGRIPAMLREAIETAPQYAEGRGVRMEVRTKKDLAAVQKLVAVKIAH